MKSCFIKRKKSNIFHYKSSTLQYDKIYEVNKKKLSHCIFLTFHLVHLTLFQYVQSNYYIKFCVTHFVQQLDEKNFVHVNNYKQYSNINEQLHLHFEIKITYNAIRHQHNYFGFSTIFLKTSFQHSLISRSLRCV